MIHLHCHSEASIRDSIIRLQPLAEKIKNLGMSAIALTDHGNTLAAVKMYKICVEVGLEFIYGCEIYVCDDVTVKGTRNYHLIVLAMNEEGRINLNRLITISNRKENKYRKPRIDLSILKEYSNGLIVLSACLAGEVAYYVAEKQEDKAREIALQYKAVFGDRYYIELQARNDPTQIYVNQRLSIIAKDLNIECVVTTDAHYLNKEDKDYQKVYAFNGAYSEDGETYADCYIQSEDEVRGNLKYFDKKYVDRLIENTHIIAGRCKAKIPLSPPIMPRITTPKQFETNKEWLESICKKGFQEKLNIDLDNPKEEDTEYINRYKYELNALEKMEFIDYILLVCSYANIVQKRGIARGSGGGSLINYLTNITEIDPLQYKLMFERFIDVEALNKLENGEITKKELKLPDIDLDFSSDSLETVLLYLRDTYGEERVASIGKFGYDLTKGTIRDMCKPLEIPLDIADSIAKSFDNYSIDDIDNMVNGTFPTENGVEKAIQYVKEYPKLFDYVRHLNNLPKSFGLHACGRVVSVQDLDYYMPSFYDSNGIRYLQGDMHDVEDLGLVKIDLLGLRTIDVEYDALQQLSETKDFISPRQDMNDPKVLDIFKNGDTVGIFQFSSNGMKKVLKKMNVNSIDDIIAANALFRPGSLNHIDLYCDRKAGRVSIEYLHPSLEPILKSTYGIIVYQEQLIEIGKMAGLKNPDLLRKATGKKDINLINQIKPELFEKLKAKGWNDEQLEQLWTDMLNFARYSFNKAHAAAYSIIAYMTAKIKAYHPAVFYSALLNSYLGRSDFVKDKAADIIADVQQHDISIKAFNITDDHRRCSVSEDGEIIYAYSLIKDIDANTADILFKNRENKFDCASDLFIFLVEQGMAKSKIEKLIAVDVFSDWGNTNQMSECFKMLQLLNFGNAKRISKKTFNEKFPEWLRQIVVDFSTDKKKDGSEATSYFLEDKKSLLYLANQRLKMVEEPKTHNKIQIQLQSLGFVNIKSKDPKERRNLLITKKTPMKSKVDGKIWGYILDYYSLYSGKIGTLTLYDLLDKEKPVNEKDIIFAKDIFKNKFGYWTLRSYEVVE